MTFADTEPGIESQLIDLSAVPMTHLRGLNSSALRQAMTSVLERTGRLWDVRANDAGGHGERID